MPTELLRVGIIGTGNIGADHVDRVAHQISGARVTALFDVATDRVQELAGQIGAVAMATASHVINSSDVDAVIIASPGEFHAGLTLECIAAGKPVLCEKPLAPTVEECEAVIAAEQASGRRLVQVGFMRRNDVGYRHLKDNLNSGAIGEALILHCEHRNPDVPDSFTSEMSMTDSVIHEIDTARWLLDEEIVRVRVIAGKQTPNAASHLNDPQLVIMESESGVIVSVEVFVNAKYGYDVRCEVVGSNGFTSLGTQDLGQYVSDTRRSVTMPANWRIRFGDAYRAEIQDWVNGIAAGESRGANSFDGLCATHVAQAAVRAVTSGVTVEIPVLEQPAFYQ